ILGLVAAGFHAWSVWKRYNDDREAWFKRKLTYECAARLSDNELKPFMNEYGNINVRRLCITNDDFFVSLDELDAVRTGTMKFETGWEPFDWLGTIIMGLLWAIATVLLTVGVLIIVNLGRWVWGKAG